MGTPSFRSLCRIAPRERGSRPWPGAPGRVPPAPPACGPTPCPPCAAAVPPPARPACGSPGNVAAKAGQARPGQVGRLRCSGAPFRAARPSPQAGRFAGLASLLPLAGCGVGAPARPGPHDVGAMGPSAPPARAAALRPALPARPRLRRRPCRAALPAHSPHGVAAPRGSCFGAPPARTKPPLGRSPPCGRLAHCAAGAACSARAVRGPQFIPPRALAAQAPPSPRFARGGAQGYAACGRDAARSTGRQGQGKRRAGRASPATISGLACRCPGRRGKPWRVSRPLAGPRPFFILSLGVLFMVLWAVACRVSPSAPALWLWAVPAPASGCVLRSGACVAAFGWGPSRSRRGLFASRAAALRAFSVAGGAWAVPGGSSAAVRRRCRFALVRVSLPAGAQAAGVRAAGVGRWFPAQGWRCKV